MAAREKSTVDVSAKMAVVRNHIDAAIFMIAHDVNPFSTHVVIMAAEEIITAIAKLTGLPFTLDVEAYLTARGREVWKAKKPEAYNYLKHGHRDYKKGFQGPDRAALQELNDLFLVIVSTAYVELTGKKPDVVSALLGLTGILYQGWVDWSVASAEHPGLQAMLDYIGPVDRAAYRDGLRAALELEALEVARSSVL